MTLNIVKLHQVIDQWAAEERAAEEKAKEAAVAGEVASPSEPSSQPNATQETVAEVAARVLPEGQRVARTKTQGDRVYLLDDNKKTRAWITKPEILESLGFEMGDVVEVDDNEFLKYQMAAAIYKMPDEA